MESFTKQVQENFNKMMKTGKLFRSSLTGYQIWDLYLKSFKNDPIFRDPDSSSHKCNTCKSFLRRYGNIVSVDKSYNIISLFDGVTEEEYKPSADALSKALRESTIANVFIETIESLNKMSYEKTKNKQSQNFQLGIEKNSIQYTPEAAKKYGRVKTEVIYTFDHLNLKINKDFVRNSHQSIETIMSDYRSAQEVFHRAMKEIPIDTLILVKDLINQGSLLNGATYLAKIDAMITFKYEYDKLPESKKELWSWRLPFLLGEVAVGGSNPSEVPKIIKNIP